MMKRLDGVNCLLMTPFTKQGDIDHVIDGGVISGSATLIPSDDVQLYKLAKQRRWSEARDLYYGKILPLLNYCTFDPHAYSVSKYALYYQGIIDCPDVREPNPDAGEARAKEVREVLEWIGVLSPTPA